jgi:hypothetical protein
MHIPKFRIGAGKVLANASTPDFSGTSDIILGYALSSEYQRRMQDLPGDFRRLLLGVSGQNANKNGH